MVAVEDAQIYLGDEYKYRKYNILSKKVHFNWAKQLKQHLCNVDNEK